jgi:hypothetical protein
MALDRLALLQLRDEVTLAEAAELLAEKAGRNAETRAATDLLVEAVGHGELQPVVLRLWNEGDWNLDPTQVVVTEMETTVTRTDFEAWRAILCVPEARYDQGHDASSGPAQDVLATPISWEDHARAIADELFDHDTRLKTRDSLANYANRVMEIMQTREIHGPRGRIVNPKTIQRLALQSDKWWARKRK